MIHIKIIDADRETRSKYHTKGPKVIRHRGANFSDPGDMWLGICDLWAKQIGYKFNVSIPKCYNL